MLPISGFLPVPLPMMIPFMGAQSMVIGKAFGEGFQYGKRKISAMPNEEFNKLTFESMMSNFRTELKASIPTMNASLKDMQPMVEVVVREFFNYISLVTKIVTGTGEGPNIFSEEGLEIGEAIAHSLGTHLPQAHGKAPKPAPTVPTGPNVPSIDTFVPPTNVPPPVITLEQPKIPPPPIGGKVKATPIQIAKRDKLIKDIFENGMLWKDIKNAGAKKVIEKKILALQQELVNLLNNYDFT